MVKTIDFKRRTGRTSRMLERAIQLANAGRAVYVIAANTREKLRLSEMLSTDTSIKVETPESCGNFDWRTLSLTGAHPNCVVLVDHFAIEINFNRLLEEWSAYDEAAP